MKYLWFLLFFTSFAGAVDNPANNPKVCFIKVNYQNTNPQQLCLAAGEEANWLNVAAWNDQVVSVIVPKGLQVTLYKNDSFNPPLVQLSESAGRNLLAELGMTSAISSVRVSAVPQVCLFEDANYQGIKHCLSAAESVTWSAEDYLYKKVSSIRVPEGLHAILYREQSNKKLVYTILEDTDITQLSALQLQDSISGVFVGENDPLPCDSWCAIRQRFGFSLPQVYNTLWDDPHVPHKYIGLSFQRALQQNFDVNLAPSLQIEIRAKTATLVNGSRRIEYLLHPEANSLSLLFFQDRFTKGRQIQFLESNDTDYQGSSPIFEVWPSSETEQVTQLTVNNHHLTYPLVLTRAILAASRNPVRPQRNLDSGKILCFFSPLMTLYNYLIQGQCNQPQFIAETLKNYLSLSVDNENVLLHVAGSARPLAPSSTAPVLEKPTSAPALTLEYVSSRDDMGPLSIYSASITCRVPINYILSLRKKRAAEGGDCIHWTLDTITLYTLLFGGGSEITWNSEHFGQTVDTILRSGSTGYAVSDPALEAELIEAVKQQAEAKGDNGQQSKRAFEYAQLAYTDYILDHADPDQPEQNPAVTPQVVQTSHSLGTYILYVDEYTPDPVIPRIFEQGRWMAHPEKKFDVDVVHTSRPQIPHMLSELLARWKYRYETRHRPNAAQADAQLFSAINNVIKFLKMDLTSEVDPFLGEDLYLIVRLRGSNEPLSLLSASIHPDHIVIRESLSAPENVLLPYTEGAVRGAGTAAVAWLARYAQRNQITSIVTDVISQPSARVKKKLGFRLSNE